MSIFGDAFGLIGKGADYLLGVQDRRRADHDANQQRAAEQALQREFAQNGIRWKVADAKAAGVHPAFALGAPVSSYSPIAVGDSRSPVSDFASMGQDVSRAVHATSTGRERVDAYTEKLRQQQLTKGDLENQLLASQIARLRQASNPPLPSGTRSDDKMEPPPAPEHSGLRIGENTSHNPKFSDAQKFEDRYGEPGEWIAGGVNIGADAYHMLTSSPWFGEVARYIQGLRRGTGSRRWSNQVRRRWPD